MNNTNELQLNFALNTGLTATREYVKAVYIARSFFNFCTLIQARGIWQGSSELSYLLSIKFNPEIYESEILPAVENFTRFIKVEYKQESVLKTLVHGLFSELI